MGPDRRVAALAARQHGVFTRAQALERGLSERQIDRRLQDGRFLRLEPGTYATGGAPATFHRQAMAAVLASGGVTSHRTAAFLLGLVSHKPRSLDVTLTHGSNHGAGPGRIVHQARRLRRVDAATTRGIPVTAPMRTIVDLAGELAPNDLEAVLDGSLIKGITTIDGFDQYLTTLGPKRGVGLLRKLIADRRDGVPESELEREFIRLARKAGLPPPTRQFWIGRSRIDFVYDEQRIVVELDGSSHRSAAALTRDSRRQNRIALGGWTILRYTWEMVTQEPDEVLSDILTALSREAS